jgi:hypothetical protein
MSRRRGRSLRDRNSLEQRRGEVLDRPVDALADQLGDAAAVAVLGPALCGFSLTDNIR